MINPNRLFGFLANGVVPEMTALDESLAEHDKKFHPQGYKEGDPCNKRANMEKKDSVDDIGDASGNGSPDDWKKSLPSDVGKEYEELMGWFKPEDGHSNADEAAGMLFGAFGKGNEREAMQYLGLSCQDMDYKGVKMSNKSLGGYLARNLKWQGEHMDPSKIAYNAEQWQKDEYMRTAETYRNAAKALGDKYGYS